MSLIDSFSCDIEEEIDREVEDNCLDHDITVNDPDEQSFYPESFQRLLSDSSYAIAACYVPFCTTLGCPKLSSKISEAEKQRLSEQGQSSRFIIDGRHQRIAAVSPGMSAQYIINHEGLCIYVSPSLPASNSDISMFRLNKHAIMAGLNEMLTNIGDTLSSVYILADKGYHFESDPELLTLPNGVNDITFNKYRILIENYFGRMTRVFQAA
ncbi:hypothetical protein WA158_006902 [Blastocystis sp. Blastoise]